MSIDPTKIFLINGTNAPLLAIPAALGVSVNNILVAVAAGKRHRVMGWIAQGSGAGVSTFQLKSSGGAFIMGALAVPGNGAGLNDKLPISNTGYFETLTGEGLQVDIAGAAIQMTVFYITYTPGA